ncbi:RNA pseudouridine synthase [Ilyomonas limi]|uniref:Pseudouridine synthase n=1 Tax=Ilyomonas limi TaxID=2575867 RepID=A0A4U3KWN5_9BACT|nr:RNA pseudouridine synthase [Ilyomonas limi]TKK67001.1 RNA pseudouridine synthase [Ilyomonas limi]
MFKLHSHIILENVDFVAINKPAGMLSIPDRKQSEPSLKDFLIQQYGNIFTVHRLDRETSGVIVFAKNETAHKQLSQLFQGREVAKYYYGLVNGVPIPPEGSIDTPIMEHFAKNGKMITHAKGKPSLTDYEVLENFQIYSWIKFRIHTGRTHQIRVHMQSIGHPIVCDELYGNPEPVYISKLKRKYNLSKNELEEQPILKRLALHSALLQFTFDNQAYSLEALLPKDLRALLQQLRKLKG